MNYAPVSHSPNPVGALCIDGWWVDAPALRISKNGKSTKLEPRAMAVLSYLANRPGETIFREELVREVWPGQVVVDEALGNAIAKLRKAFEDDSHRPRIIETIPKVGYRLIGEVTGSATNGKYPASAATNFRRMPNPIRRSLWVGIVALVGVVIGVALLWQSIWRSLDEPVIPESTAGASVNRPSIAVLPFTNMSGDPEQEYFADGMTDDLITDLSKISGLLVISRNSTFKYKGKTADVSQVAREFGVQYVLEGSVRRAGERIRINAQLIDASTSGHVWAERFDRPMKDIFAVQDTVTQSVVSALAVRLTAEEQAAHRRIQTDSADAYEAFLRGQAHLELSRWEDFAVAIANFEKALELDPNYSRVHGALAEVYWHVWSNGDSTELGMSPEETFSKMEHYLAEAMKQPNPTAQAQHIRTRYLTKQGRFDEALVAAEQMVALSPSNAAGYRALGRAANKVGKPAQGLDAMRRVRRINPRGDDAGAYAYRIGESLFLLGKYEEAEAEFLEAQKRSGDGYFTNMMLAGVFAQLGRDEEAKAALRTFSRARAKKGRSPHTLATFDEWAFVPSVRKQYVESLRLAGMPLGD